MGIYSEASRFEETRREQAWAKFAEDWISGLMWSDDTPQQVRDAVAMNVRGFWAHARPAIESETHQAFSDAMYAGVLAYENTDRAAEGMMEKVWPDYQGSYIPGDSK